MVTVVAFSAVSLVAVLLSAANRSVLSTSVVSVRAEAPVVSTFAVLVLFSILFSDGMKVTAKDLRGIHSLPLRTLLICLPLTLVLTALLVHLVVEIPWATSFLLGAALSPADPVCSPPPSRR
jgi:NhaP-type Na+/H+ or K+/H+ antiporter